MPTSGLELRYVLDDCAPVWCFNGVRELIEDIFIGLLAEDKSGEALLSYPEAAKSSQQ